MHTILILKVNIPHFCREARNMQSKNFLIPKGWNSS